MTHTLNKLQIKPAESKYPFKLAVLRDYDKSLDKVWHVEYYIYDIDQHKLIRRRITLSHPTAYARTQEAKDFIKDINTALKKGAYFQKEQTTTLPISTPVENLNIIQAADYYITYQKNILKKRTIESYTTDLKRFKTYLKSKSKESLKITQFNFVEAQQFLDHLILTKTISNRTINNQRNSLKVFFNFFLKRKLIKENPLQDFKSLPQISSAHAAFSKEQAAAVKYEIIRQGDTQLLLFISAIYFCAIRPRYELRLLKVKDILEKTIRIQSENAKNSQTQHIKIPEPFEKLLQQHKIKTFNPEYYVFGYNDQPGPEPLGRNNLYNRHRAILDKLNLQNKYLDTYSWKHTGAIALFQLTQNIEIVRQHCRHSSIATTQQYLRDLGQFIDYSEIDKFPSF